MKTILIVDDEEPVQALMAATLGNSNRYKILLAPDGEAALRLIEQCKPDLLFLDIMSQ